MDLAFVKRLEKKAYWVRKKTLQMCVRSDSGHLASSLSCTDILVTLYYGGIIKHNPKNPNWKERDRFILSKGHGGVALYPILADLGFFSEEELENFCQLNGILGVHPDNKIPGIETVTGSLGHGLGISVGLALGAKLDKKGYKIVTLLGDGECYEGSIWEAALFGGHHNLNNLVAIIDRNNLCVTDFTENFLGLNPLADKWKSFGWDVKSIDGHSFCDISNAFDYFTSRISGKPLVLIANTIKGKGISFIEGQSFSHTYIPKGEQLEQALRELSNDTD